MSLRFSGRHLEIPTSGFIVSIRKSTIDFLESENMGAAVGISLLCVLEAEIRLM